MLSVGCAVPRQELSLLTNVVAIKCPPPSPALFHPLPPPLVFMFIYHLKIDYNSRLSA